MMLIGMNEKEKRLYLAIEAGGIGYGGISAVSHLTQVSRATIRKGIKELAALESGEMQRTD